uniref:RNase H type-1 domain-containing protein n=1 Tax=Cannabis sativa TaxID=3483 RepID=A0A803P460_CANSA
MVGNQLVMPCSHASMPRQFGKAQSLQLIFTKLMESIHLQPPATKLVHQQISSTPATTTGIRGPVEDIAWKPPDVHMLKMNVDAAANYKDKISGIGAVVCDFKGEVIAAFSKPGQGCFRSDEMEANALFHSLNWAAHYQSPIANVETL